MEKIDKVVLNRWVGHSQVLQVGLDLIHRSLNDGGIRLLPTGLTSQEYRKQSDGESHIGLQGQRV